MLNKKPSLLNLLLMIIFFTMITLAAIFWLDRPIAFWVYHHHLIQKYPLKYLTYIKLPLTIVVFLCYLLPIIRISIKKNSDFDDKCLFVANTVFFTQAIKINAKHIFGRTWVGTWIHNNPSLIKNNIDKFNFFQGGHSIYGSSFPSGHVAVVSAFMIALYFIFPKLWWLWALGILLVTVGIIGCNYHYLSDCIAGFGLAVIVTNLSYIISDRHVLDTP